MVFVTIISTMVFANSTMVVALPPSKISPVLYAAIKNEFSDSDKIYQVFNYVDTTGVYYCVLLENTLNAQNNHSVTVIDFKFNSGKFDKMWKMHDFARNGSENGIWLWPEYMSFQDNGYGVIDPVVVYASGGDNAGNGRLNIIIYHGGMKVGVRSFLSDMDESRYTLIDKSFYDLPSKTKNIVIKILNKIESDDRATLPQGWKLGFNKNSIKIRDAETQ